MPVHLIWLQEHLRDKRTRTEKPRKSTAGRKKYFDPAALRDIWHAVETIKCLSAAKSAAAVCRHLEFVDENFGPNGTIVRKRICGKTLLRRYREAQGYLRHAACQQECVADCRAKNLEKSRNSLVAAEWRRQLEHMIAVQKTADNPKNFYFRTKNSN
jgi:hypothetical protein